MERACCALHPAQREPTTAIDRRSDMTDTYFRNSLPLSVFQTASSTSVNLLDLLRNVYVDQVSSITSLQIQYRDASWLANAPHPAFSYWDPANPVVTRVLNNGVDIGGQGATVNPTTAAVTVAPWNATTVTNANFG